MDIGALRNKGMKWIGKYKYLLLVVVIGVGLMLLPFGTESETVAEEPRSQQQDQSLDVQLEQILTNIQGVGRVQVLLTLRSGEQTVYQTDIPSADRQDTVIITDKDRGQSGLIQQVIPPSYRGAIVLCQGADSASVCLAIKEAVSKVTGLDTSEISVLKMK